VEHFRLEGNLQALFGNFRYSGDTTLRSRELLVCPSVADCRERKDRAPEGAVDFWDQAIVNEVTQSHW